MDALPGGDRQHDRHTSISTSARGARIRRHVVDPTSATAPASARSGTSPPCRWRPPATVSVIWRFSRTSPLELAAGQPTQTARPDRDGHGHGAQQRRQPRCRPRRPLHDHRRQPGRRGGDHGRRRDGRDQLAGREARDRHAHRLRRSRRQRRLRDVNTEPRRSSRSLTRRSRRRCRASRSKVKVVSGQVFIKLPGQRARARRPGPAKGFVPLTGAANIPVGSQLDTRKGRVALTSAADTGGREDPDVGLLPGDLPGQAERPQEEAQEAHGADHRPRDEGPDRALAVRAAEGRARRGDAKKKKKGPKAVLGKLWGSGKGKFRTNGKYSAATVRGTIWLVRGSLRGHADEGHARDGPGARLQAQEDHHGEGGPQLPGTRPTGGEQGQAAIDRATDGATGAVTPGT